MTARGLKEPLLIVTDGNPGVLKSIDEVFPQSLKQRCQRHRMENILGKAPKEVHEELKAAILESFPANNYEEGLEKGREVIKRYSHRFPSAMKCMEETLEDCLQVLKLPREHHKRLRTANLLERTFGENKRRTKVIPHFFTEKAAVKLTYAVLLAVASKWRGVRMDVFTARQVEELRTKVFTDSAEKESAA
jgi:putative transposase